VWYLFTIPCFAEDPPAWIAAEAFYKLTIEPPLATVELEYRFLPVREGWLDARLAGPSLVIDEVEGPLLSRPDGTGLILGPGTNPATIRATGSIYLDNPGALSLPVLPAAVQHIEVSAPGFDVTITGEADGVLASQSSLLLSWVPQRVGPPPEQTALVKAEVGNAVWEEDGDLKLHSRIQWHVLRGQQQAFEVNAAGISEIEVLGEQILRWEQLGSLLKITAREPVKGGFTVELRGRAPIPSGSFALPAFDTTTARHERWYALGSSEEVDLVPESGRTVSSRQVPDWVRALPESPARVWWSGERPALRSERYQAEMGPDTVVERAELLVVAAEDGLALLRSTWFIRNERRQYLHFVPSPGFEVVAARRGSFPVNVLSDGQGGIYIALEKSLETVQGMVASPLEVTWIGRLPAWKKKGAYPLLLPSVDAPIQEVRWEVHLPRGFDPKGRSDPGAGPVYIREQEQARAALDNAIEAYRDNDFETAQTWVHTAQELTGNEAGASTGASSGDLANADRLQSNLDLLLENTIESSNAEADDSNARRIRDMANARSGELRTKQDEAEKKAEEATRSGDLEEAERQYQAVIESAEELQRFEQAGSEEQKERYAQAQEGLEEVRKQKDKNSSFSSRNTRSSGSDSGVMIGGQTGEFEDTDGEPDTGGYIVDGYNGSPKAAPEVEHLSALGYLELEEPMIEFGRDRPVEPEIIYKETTVFEFEGEEIAGELVAPSAGVLGVIADPNMPPPVVDILPQTIVIIDSPVDGTGDRMDQDFDSIVDEEDLSPEPEFLERVPTGRSYQDVVVALPGVASGKAAGRGRAAEKAAEPPAQATPPTEPAAPPRAAHAESAPTTPPVTTSTPRAPNRPAPPAEGAKTADPRADDDKKPATEADNRTVVFAQRPTPLTLALPLDGTAIYRSEALLQSGENPTITISYKKQKR
jgi:hypothetical protein